MTAWLVFVLECAFVGGVAAYLIMAENYEDGILGRFALGLCLCVPCSMVVGEAVMSEASGVASATQWVPAVVSWVMFGVCVFIGRHAYRFYRFSHNGEHAWTPGTARADWKRAEPRAIK